MCVFNYDIIYNTVQQLYSKYIVDPQYVYKSCGDYVVVMKLLEDTKTNLNRNDITDPTNAKYRADKLYTELIFNKFDPNKTVHSISNTFYYKNKITYMVNSITYPDSFDNDLDKVCTNGIHFFKSIERALLWELDFNKILYTGEYKTYYENGQIKSKCNYIDSELCGEYIVYYENGHIYIKCNYIDDKKCGEYTYYYDCGQIKKKCNYVDGLLCSECIDYYTNGQIRMKCNYVNGLLCGECIDYYTNGQIKMKCNYDTIYNTVQQLYGKYIDNPQYVYKSCGDYVAFTYHDLNVVWYELYSFFKSIERSLLWDN